MAVKAVKVTASVTGNRVRVRISLKPALYKGPKINQKMKQDYLSVLMYSITLVISSSVTIPL
jgi:hypothetical protein